MPEHNTCQATIERLEEAVNRLTHNHSALNTKMDSIHSSLNAKIDSLLERFMAITTNPNPSTPLPTPPSPSLPRPHMKLDVPRLDIQDISIFLLPGCA